MCCSVTGLRVVEAGRLLHDQAFGLSGQETVSVTPIEPIFALCDPRDDKEERYEG